MSPFKREVVFMVKTLIFLMSGGHQYAFASIQPVDVSSHLFRDMLLSSKIRIKENSFAARIAAWKLEAGAVALVLGKTIHLYNVTEKEFLQHDNWVKHELKHIEQFERYGTIRFLLIYLLEWFRNGYTNNRFEVEAREAEKI